VGEGTNVTPHRLDFSLAATPPSSFTSRSVSNTSNVHAEAQAQSKASSPDDMPAWLPQLMATLQQINTTIKSLTRTSGGTAQPSPSPSLTTIEAPATAPVDCERPPTTATQHPRSPPIWHQIKCPTALESKYHLRGVENFAAWKDRIISNLQCTNMTSVVFGTKQCPDSDSSGNCPCPANADSTFHVIDQAALGYLKNQLDGGLLPTARRHRRAASLMAFLESEYGSGQSDLMEAMKMQLHDELEELKFPSTMTSTQIEKFINTVDRLRSELIDIGDSARVADKPLGLRVARKFPDDSSKKQVLQRKMTWTEIKHDLRLERSLFGNQPAKNTSSTPSSNSKSTTVTCSYCKNRNH